MRQSKSILLLIACAFGLCLPLPSQADTFYYGLAQGGNPGWFGAIWTNPAVTVGQCSTFGNNYVLSSNGVCFGASSGNTRLRTPTLPTADTGCNPTNFAYPGPWYMDTNNMAFRGDSLTVNPYTELRFKIIGAPEPSAGTAVPTFWFTNSTTPSAAGLILNGGLLNVGSDAGTAGGNLYDAKLAGVIRVDAESILDSENNVFGGTKATRGFNIAGKLTGAGALLIPGGMITSGSSTNRVLVSGPDNTYTGKWIVTAGWLMGTGANGLGTNNTFLIDPTYPWDTKDFVVNVGSPVIVRGPAIFEPFYDINNAGTLLLTNGGQMKLHQNCCFSSVVIEGTPLSAGTHFFAELAAAYPNTFTGSGMFNFGSTGSGSITVQAYGPPPVFPPSITTQPQPQLLYPGATAHFSVGVGGSQPLTNHWRRNGTILSDTGNVQGSATTALTITNVGTANAGSYDFVVTNSTSGTNSTAAPLTLVTATETYEEAVTNQGPFAFYQLNETSDPSAGGVIAYDYAGGYNGVYNYGSGLQSGFNGVAGPRASDGFPGFASGNLAAQFTYQGSSVTLPALNLNANTVTLMAWINPTASQNLRSGLVFCRGGSTAAGLNLIVNNGGAGPTTLGYTWNNQDWNTSLTPPTGQWSLVALVVTPTNGTIYLINSSGIYATTHVGVHTKQGFEGTTYVGNDGSGTSGTKAFDGTIDDVAVFNKSLTQTDLLDLYTAAAGSAPSFGPTIGNQPTDVSVYVGQTAQFTVGAVSTQPLSYQWQTGAGANLNNGGQYGGVTASTLYITNVTMGNDASTYKVVVSAAPFSPVTSSTATLHVLPTGAPLALTLTNSTGAQEDYNTTNRWSDGRAASISAAANPGSTFEVPTNKTLRTPDLPLGSGSGTFDDVFPGDVLTMDGNGVWNSSGAGANISDLRLKHAAGGTCYFKKLVMNGGQIDQGEGGLVVLTGEIDTLANTPVYTDNGSDPSRSFRFDSLLTGGGTIEYHGYGTLTSFVTTNTCTLNIANPANTFTGQWNVLLGTLIGTAASSLGTNTINIGVNGALETTYDVNNPKGSLTNNGRMFLHQNDTFYTVTVGAVTLSPGTYSFAELNAAWPASFPASWLQQDGSAASTGSGSITVLAGPPPPQPPTIKSIHIIGGNLVLSGTNNTGATGPYYELTSTNLALTNWTVLTNGTFDASGNFSITNPVTVEPKRFFRLLVP